MDTNNLSLKPSISATLAQSGELFTIFPGGPTTVWAGDGEYHVDLKHYSLVDIRQALESASKNSEKLVCLFESGTGRSGFVQVPGDSIPHYISLVDHNKIRIENSVSECVVEHQFTLLRRKPKAGTYEPPLRFELPPGFTRAELHERNTGKRYSQHMAVYKDDMKISVATTSLGRGYYSMHVYSQVRRTGTRNDYVRYSLVTPTSWLTGLALKYQVADLIRKAYIEVLTRAGTQCTDIQFSSYFGLALSQIKSSYACILDLDSVPISGDQARGLNPHRVRVQLDDAQIYQLDIYNDSLG